MCRQRVVNMAAYWTPDVVIAETGYDTAMHDVIMTRMRIILERRGIKCSPTQIVI